MGDQQLRHRGGIDGNILLDLSCVPSSGCLLCEEIWGFEGDLLIYRYTSGKAGSEVDTDFFSWHQKILGEMGIIRRP